MLAIMNRNLGNCILDTLYYQNITPMDKLSIGAKKLTSIERNIKREEEKKIMGTAIQMP